MGAASTNRIAERAGVSVGSLYQYFPNKEAVLFALAERHVQRMQRMLEEKAAALVGVPLEDGVSLYVRAVFQQGPSPPPTAAPRVLRGSP